MGSIKLLALNKLYHATDKPTSCEAASLIEAALVCLVTSEEIFADWIVNTPITPFPLIVDRVYDLICDVNRRLKRSSYTYFRGLPEEEIRVILNNYHDYLINQL